MRVSRSAMVLAFALAVVSGASAQEDRYGWYVDGVQVPDEPWRGHDGPFLATLVITEDLEATVRAWFASPPDTPPSTNIFDAAPGSTVIFCIFVAHCQVDSSGVCDVSGGIRIETSDGRLLPNGREIPWSSAQKPGPHGNFDAFLGLRLHASHGSFSYRATIYDHIGNRQISLVQESHRNWNAVTRPGATGPASKHYSAQPCHSCRTATDRPLSTSLWHLL